MVNCSTPATGQVAGVGGNKFGQDVGDGRGVMVGSDLGIAGHSVVQSELMKGITDKNIEIGTFSVCFVVHLLKVFRW
jgi:tetrahydromethanopterin S-methyltransferase subunit H